MLLLVPKMQKLDHLMVGKCFTDQGVHAQFSTALVAIKEEGENKNPHSQICTIIIDQRQLGKAKTKSSFFIHKLLFCQKDDFAKIKFVILHFQLFHTEIN